MKAHSTGKIDKIYGPLFQILNNVDNFERRGKQSFYKSFIQQLDTQMNVHDIQIQIYQDVKNDFDKHEKDVYAVMATINSLIEKNTNWKALQELFDSYEKANANYSMI